MAADSMKPADEVSISLGEAPLNTLKCQLCGATIVEEYLGYHWQNNCSFFGQVQDE